MSKSSLLFFNPSSMSLSLPHPLWTSCSSNPFEVNKARVQAALLSVRYKTDYLSRHWNFSNPNGFCILCPGKFLFGTVQHFLVHCEALSETRSRIIDLWSASAEDNVNIHHLLMQLLKSPSELLCQFLLEQVVILVQHGLVHLDTLFYLTRTWCYGLHRRRLQLLGLFNRL